MIKEFICHNFVGFYDTIISPRELESRAVESLSGGSKQFICPVIDKATTEVLQNGDYFDRDSSNKTIAELWSKKYMEVVNGGGIFASNIPVVGVRITSPRFYNFETDHCVIKIDLSDSDFDTLLTHVREDGFAKLVERQFTPRDGFAPFYSSDVADWLKKDIRDWNTVEMGVLFEYVYDKAYAEQYGDSKDSILDEVYEHYTGNNDDFEHTRCLKDILGNLQNGGVLFDKANTIAEDNSLWFFVENFAVGNLNGRERLVEVR